VHLKKTKPYRTIVNSDAKMKDPYLPNQPTIWDEAPSAGSDALNN